MPGSAVSIDSFTTFGDLLRYLRLRAQLTQEELGIAVGYSEAQISRLERNQRRPVSERLEALFIPALHLEDEPEIMARLLDLAAQAQGEEEETERPAESSSATARPAAPLAWQVAPRTNLPAGLTSFIGREQEISAVCQCVLDHRMVTLTGAGGVGKTRLALRAAEELLEYFSEGVWLVELAPLTEPDLVPEAVISALKILPSPDRSLEESLVEFLRERNLVLLLDNCEHLVGACAHLAETLLIACPQLKILATSRELLGVPGEVTFRVPSLSLPSEETRKTTAFEQIAGSEAVQLFVERARQALPSFTVVDSRVSNLAFICRRLDGIPLAIEFAAARVNLLSLEQIADRLEHDFGLLTSNLRTVMPRHRTLRAVIEWSYNLMSSSEQVLLRRLPLFAGGWTIEAAEKVCAGNGLEAGEVFEVLSSLVNKSLVVTALEENHNLTPRFRCLETIRQFAHEKLAEAVEEEELERRFLAYFIELAETSHEMLRGPEQRDALFKMRADYNNYTAALNLALSHGNIEAALRLMGALFIFWVIHLDLSTDASFYSQASIMLAQQDGTLLKSRWYAKALYTASRFLIGEKLEIRKKLMEESLAIYTSLDDRKWMGACLNFLSWFFTEDQVEAIQICEQSLAVLEGTLHTWEKAQAYYLMGIRDHWRGELEAQHTHIMRAKELFTSVGDQFLLLEMTDELIWMEWRKGKIANARSIAEEGIRVSLELGYTFVLPVLYRALVEIALAQGDFSTAEQALVNLVESTSFHTGNDYKRVTLEHQGLFHLVQGRLEKARQFYERAVPFYLDEESVAPFESLGQIAYYEGNYDLAAVYLEHIYLLYSKINSYNALPAVLCELGDVAFARGDPRKADEDYRQALAIWKNRRSIPDFPGCFERLAKLSLALGQANRAAFLLGASQALREKTGLVIYPVERKEFEQCLSGVRLALGEDGFSRAFEKGRQTPLEEALDFAGG